MQEWGKNTSQNWQNSLHETFGVGAEWYSNMCTRSVHTSPAMQNLVNIETA